MQRFELVSCDGEGYTVSLPSPTPRFPSCYLFAFVKSGSTLVDNMLLEYCRESDYAYFSLFGQAFSQGILTRNIQSDALVCFHSEGYLYSGFRHYPYFDIPVNDRSAVLLVRDPRDMLVSLYFSIAKSHIIPNRRSPLVKERERVLELEIEEFVLKRAKGYTKQLARYLERLSGADLLEIRYEDGIYDKKWMLERILSHYGLETNSSLLQRIAKKHDVFPVQENEEAHVRQVHPGNYRQKLTAETIEKLSEILAPFLERYDYARE